eukprot:4839044-Pleurochrysis_carterae.AAC.1
MKHSDGLGQWIHSSGTREQQQETCGQHQYDQQLLASCRSARCVARAPNPWLRVLNSALAASLEEQLAMHASSGLAMALGQWLGDGVSLA